jgi:hypothetical protein
MPISTTATAAMALAMLCATNLTGRTAAQSRPGREFHAERVVRTGHLNFEAPVAKVFPLFTPLGELHWAKNWDPKILYPPDGHPTEGLLFYTPDHEGTWWWMTRFDPAAHIVEYHVVAPAGFARNIKVQCTAEGDRTRVTVTDTYIGLNDHGNEFVRALDDAAYANKMKGWEEPIRAYLNQSH